MFPNALDKGECDIFCEVLEAKCEQPLIRIILLILKSLTLLQILAFWQTGGQSVIFGQFTYLFLIQFFIKDTFKTLYACCIGV